MFILCNLSWFLAYHIRKTKQLRSLLSRASTINNHPIIHKGSIENKVNNQDRKQKITVIEPVASNIENEEEKDEIDANPSSLEVNPRVTSHTLSSDISCFENQDAINFNKQAVIKVIVNESANNSEHTSSSERDTVSDDEKKEISKTSQDLELGVASSINSLNEDKFLQIKVNGPIIKQSDMRWGSVGSAVSSDMFTEYKVEDENEEKAEMDHQITGNTTSLMNDINRFIHDEKQ